MIIYSRLDTVTDHREFLSIYYDTPAESPQWLNLCFSISLTSISLVDLNFLLEKGIHGLLIGNSPKKRHKMSLKCYFYAQMKFICNWRLFRERLHSGSSLDGIYVFRTTGRREGEIRRISQHPIIKEVR